MTEEITLARLQSPIGWAVAADYRATDDAAARRSRAEEGVRPATPPVLVGAAPEALWPQPPACVVKSLRIGGSHQLSE